MLILGEKKVFWWYHNWFDTFRILLVLSIFLQNSLSFKAFKVRTNSWNELSHEANINLFHLFPCLFHKNFDMLLNFGYSEFVVVIVNLARGGNFCFFPVLPRTLLPRCPHSALAALFAGLVSLHKAQSSAAIPCTADRIVQNAPQRVCSYTKVFLPLYLMTRIVESPSPNLVMGVRRTSYASGLISSVRL